MSNCYFWKDEKVFIVELEEGEFLSSQKAIAMNLIDLYCVDTGFADIGEGDMRYGIFRRTGWKQGSYQDFPPMFKLELLVLGIR